MFRKPPLADSRIDTIDCMQSSYLYIIASNSVAICHENAHIITGEGF